MYGNSKTYYLIRMLFYVMCQVESNFILQNRVEDRLQKDP